MTGRSLALALILVTLVASRVEAADYPASPITIVVPFAAGGSVDMAARSMAVPMSRILNTPVIIMNKPGAAGSIGVQSVAASRPDGYTLLLASSSMTILPLVEKTAGRQPTVTIDHLVPIALISADPPILVVKRESQWSNAKPLIDDARQRPGRMSYASTGVNGLYHIAMELLSREARITLRHVPYAGVGPALTDLLAGQVDMMWVIASVALPQMRAGKLLPLLVASDKRVGALPEVPTVKELGYPGAEMYLWTGLFAPAGTPDAAIRTLRDTLRQVVTDKELTTSLGTSGITLDFRTDAAFRQFLAADAARVATGLGLTPPSTGSLPSVAPMPTSTAPSSEPSVMPLPKDRVMPSEPSVMPLPQNPSK